MVRKNRIKLTSDGAIYHVTTRTSNSAFFFEPPSIREWVYQRILRVAESYYVELHAIAVMSNHYHLVFTIRKPPINERDIELRFKRLQKLNKHQQLWSGEVSTWYEKLTDLSDFMKSINQSIAWEINRNRKNRGHVWDGRFKSQTIENGPALFACLTYVELNPVRANLSSRPSDYFWCSTGRFHQQGQRSAGVTLPHLKVFSGIKRNLHQKAMTYLIDYLADLENGVPSKLPVSWAEWETVLESTRLEEMVEWCFRRTKWALNSLVLGSAGFCERIILEHTLQKHSRDGPSITYLFGDICNGKQRSGAFLT